MGKAEPQRAPGGRSVALRPLAGLLGVPCRIRDVRVGEIAGVYLDGAGERVIGLDVRSPGGVHRFVPWVAAELHDDEVSVRSAFLLVDDAASYSRLRAFEVSDADELAHLRVDAAGRVVRDGETVSTDDVVGIRQR
jgi:hypothetical protein